MNYSSQEKVGNAAEVLTALRNQEHQAALAALQGNKDYLGSVKQAGLKHSTGHSLQVIVLPVLKQPKTFKLANLRYKHRFRPNEASI